MQTFQIEKTDSQCVVTRQHFSGGIIIVFIVLAALTVGNVFMLYLFLVQQKLYALFVIPALGGLWLFMLLLILDSLYGNTLIVLGENGLETTYTCLRYKSQKRIELTKLCRFEKQVTRHKNNISYYLRIVSQKHTDDIILTSKQEMNNLCDQLNIFLGTLKAEIAGVPVQWKLPEPIKIELDTPVQHLELPTESRWRNHTDYFGSVGFQKHGEDKIGDIIGSFLSAAFVNGIVSIFVLELFGVLKPERQLQGATWWGFLAFLTPFILWGLRTIVVVLNHIFEWFRITTWIFAHGEAGFHTARFGSRRAANHNLIGWNSLIVCLPNDEAIKPELIAEGNDAIREYYEAYNRWQLVFLNVAGEKLLTIEHLTKPEALWMADVLLREQRAIR
jgi:hypothetical protein